MIQVDLKHLLGRLNPCVKRALETAAGLCVGRGHYEVATEHLLLALLEDRGRDINLVFQRFGIDAAGPRRGLERAAEGFRAGNTGRPVFSPGLIALLTEAWLISSIDYELGQVRSGTVLAAILADPARYAMTDWFGTLEPLGSSEFRAKFREIVAESEEEPSSPADTSGATGGRTMPADGTLARFTVNLTEEARQGRIDPVFGRDREIRQMIDILGRRRKNNPICVGDPGIGKTAIVEGLALRMAGGDVPDFLKGVELLSLDLGSLQAGAGVKGEFENRVKGLIQEVGTSPVPVILFIDEAHVLVGAGSGAGGSDAADLLKPALARGALRTIAATTWAEYTKYFEKDPALARRFQQVKLDEPSPEDAVVILRGLREPYETGHGVYVRDDAITAAVRLSARYVAGRRLPDKAVDVLDTACTRVKLSLTTKPALIEDQERRIATLERERHAIARDRATAGAADPRSAQIEAEIARITEEKAAAIHRWERERHLVARVVSLRDEAKAGGDRLAGELRDALSDLETMRGGQALIQHEVTADTVGQVIADWTGIPVGRMVADEASAILGLGEALRARIKGQDQAIAALDEGMRAAKAGVNNPGQPMGVFLFVGISGVGKTELATRLADHLFGGERFLVTINMSEFQEKHTVSKLVGAPAGYVGYGEGGLLTDAVRQRPYSVVLLDECEKAERDVLNLLYQVFDKGMLADGEGRQVDFKNTVIILTSNLADDIITAMGSRDEPPDVAVLTEAIRPALSHHFTPALLARMRIVPFYPLKPDALRQIVRLKLDAVGRRLRDNRGMAFAYSEAVVDAITARCSEIETGARKIDHIIDRTLLPGISTGILERMSVGEGADRLAVDVGADGGFLCRFQGRAPAPADEPRAERAIP
jgi:type VI secretion system protein VasG